ncbi:MAG: class I SAM-dependent methyltransferase [Actinomycetota bacterium]|nr:class I SAM-dependent methyltransferase [Actinomycetota bacterium]
MGFFNWAAPAFNRLADRWSPDDVDTIAEWLRPFVPRGGRLIDIGGGTGALAAKLSHTLDAEVIVLDPTPEMIRYVPTEPLVHAVLGSAEDMPLDDAFADAVIVSDAFHHFHDQEGAAREFSRVVRPGGGVVVLELDPSGLVMRIIVAVEKLLGEPGAFFTPEGMCAFMAEAGIDGECTRERGASYRFVGRVLG